MKINTTDKQAPEGHVNWHKVTAAYAESRCAVMKTESQMSEEPQAHPENDFPNATFGALRISHLHTDENQH